MAALTSARAGIGRAGAGVVAVALLAAGCAGPPARPPEPPPMPTADGPPPRIATDAGPFASGPVRAPAAGAYVGAWVRPARLTQPGRVTAVRGFEAALGRPLDIVHSYRRFDQRFLTASDREFLRHGAVLMLSWAGGDTRSTTLGRHDDLIRARARELRSAGGAVLLRFRWEMDRPNLAATMWSPEDYVAAWRHVRRIFEAEGVRNASWVWCPTAEGFAHGRAPAFYPGDEAVDWICVDVYAGGRLRPPTELLTPFLRWAARRPRPIVIGEFGVARTWGSAARKAWLREAAELFRANPQIKAVSYFESDPERERHGFSLTGDAPALDAFVDMVHDPYFCHPRGKCRS
jgi:hypothetical protein